MAIKISLSIELEEYSTMASEGSDYYCRLTAVHNGQKEEHIYKNPIMALEAARQVAFSWTNTFTKLKRETKLKRGKPKKLFHP